MIGAHDWLARRAGRTPDALALPGAGATWSFADLHAISGAIVAWLEPLLRPGDRVALLAEPSPNLVAWIHAVPRAGGVVVPLNLRLTETELAAQLALLQPALLVADAAHADRAQRLSGGLAHCGLHELEAPLPAPQGVALARALAPRSIGAETPHSIIFTSGSAGAPKGVVLTHGNLSANAFATGFNLDLAPQDQWLAILPLFHVGGLAILTRSLIWGFGVRLQAGFDPAAANAAIDDGVSLVSVVSVMLQRMLADRDGPYPVSFRAAILGGGPAPRRLLEEAADRRVPVLQSYGMTETASQVVTLAPGEALSHLGAAGRPLWGARVRIAEAGVPVPPGTDGEIEVRGPMITRGYFRNPMASAPLFRNGWLRSGDYGRLDARGYLTVVDRREDLIISGGENVSPAEVEETLLGHPAVAEVGVVGLPDPRWGQRPGAAVVLKADMAVTPALLEAYCRERLATYKQPRPLLVLDALPRTGNHKLHRARLCDLLMAEAARVTGGSPG